MNERAIELYKQAAEFAYKICEEEGRKGGSEDHIWLSVATGKFAELIVRECAAICKDTAEKQFSPLYSRESDGAMVCYKKVKEHFGVE